MPKFNYVALDARGQESTGVLDAPSQNEVVAQLRKSGFFPTSVIEEGKGGAKTAKKGGKVAKTAGSKSPAKAKGKGGGIVLFKKSTVKTKVLMIFTRQLATLIDAGLPLLRGLVVLAKQEKDIVLKEAIGGLADAVQGGSTFSESLAQHPKIFNKLYINMVKAGEVGGVLELVLNRLAEFQEKAQKIKGKVVAAMFYPVAVLLIAVLIVGFLLVVIVPNSRPSSRTCSMANRCRASPSSSSTSATRCRTTSCRCSGASRSSSWATTCWRVRKRGGSFWTS